MQAWLALLSLVSLVLLLLQLWLWRRQGRILARLETQQDRARQIRQDVGALCAGAVGVGERMLRLERRLRNVGERQERLELSDPGERPYAQAIRMVHRGASLEEIVSSCDLTRTEAQLLVMMHRLDADKS